MFLGNLFREEGTSFICANLSHCNISTLTITRQTQFSVLSEQTTKKAADIEDLLSKKTDCVSSSFRFCLYLSTSMPSNPFVILQKDAYMEEYESKMYTSRQPHVTFCLPIARSACCSSRVKVVKGTSSDTGRTVTVERLEAWFPASNLLPGVWSAKLRAEHIS